MKCDIAQLREPAQFQQLLHISYTITMEIEDFQCGKFQYRLRQSFPQHNSHYINEKKLLMAYLVNVHDVVEGEIDPG